MEFRIYSTAIVRRWNLRYFKTDGIAKINSRKRSGHFDAGNMHENLLLGIKICNMQKLRGRKI